MIRRALSVSHLLIPIVVVTSGSLLLAADAKEPLTPAQSLAKITAPEGFKVTLFAGEPDVVQPIAMTLDDRGRLWVIENLSYPTWKETGRDRIVIFEDTDSDGRFDKKKVFWDKGRYLSGLALGFGGVYICNAPDFAFIADKDGDDVPDAEPVVLLDGWSTQGKHNVLNALKWGPDGWLYGCNGITAPSKVGKPGTAEKDRTEINCGVWRWHPTRNIFEVYAHGTTNPWGLDWDQYGQMFITNCVIKHMFHIVPGGHYERMFGEDLNKHSYGLIPAAADHIHWAEGTKWTDSRGGKGAHDAAGGGHAHAGLMIYQGDNWPAEYRGNAFIPNVHGGRINRDTLHAKGAGYVAKHSKDFLFANDDWFRGLEMISGPDGGVYMTDWHDTGECHDYDKAETTTGRIYKIVHVGSGERQEKRELPADLSKVDPMNLVSLWVRDNNEWHARQARRLLQEQYQGQNEDWRKLGVAITASFAKSDVLSTRDRLKNLWASHAVDAIDEKLILALLDDKDEHLRGWAVRLELEDRKASDAVLAKLTAMAGGDESPRVRLELAAGLQRLPVDQRWAIAESLAANEGDAADAHLPLMIWYGIEPAVAADKARALKLAAASKIPMLRQHIARRVAAK